MKNQQQERTEYEDKKYFLCSQKTALWNATHVYFISSYAAFIYNKISQKAKPKSPSELKQVYIACFKLNC